MEDKELEQQDLNEETVHKIKITQARQGRQPYLRFNNFRNNKSGKGRQGVRSGSGNDQGNKNGNQNRDDWKCRYCNAPGHLQTECQKRKMAGAHLVDRNGKPLGGQNKAVREVESKEEDRFLGHLRQSSGEGCYSLKNQDSLNLSLKQSDHMYLSFSMDIKFLLSMTLGLIYAASQAVYSENILHSGKDQTNYRANKMLKQHRKPSWLLKEYTLYPS